MSKASASSTHQHDRQERHGQFLALSANPEATTAHRPQSQSRMVHSALVAISVFAAMALVGVAVAPAWRLGGGRGHSLTRLRSFSAQEIVTMVAQVDLDSALRYASVDADGNPGVIGGSWDEAVDVVASQVVLDVANMTFVVGPRVGGGAEYLVAGTMTVRHDCAMGKCGTLRAGFVNLHTTIAGTWQTGPDGLHDIIYVRWVEPGMHVDGKATWNPVPAGSAPAKPHSGAP